MTKLFKALGATLLASVLVLAGVAAPANAASLTSPSVSSAGAVSGSTNPNPITITFSTATSMTAGSNGISIALPTGWTFVSPYSYTSWGTSHAAVTSVTGCPANPINTAAQNSNGVINSPELWVLCTSGAGTLAAPAAFTIVLPAGVVNVGSGVDFTITTSHNPPTVIDQSVVSLNGVSSSYTVTFDGNGSTAGSTASQTSAVPAALNANGFSRTGYTFTGWNDVANGSGNAWGPGANYGFVASKTLYAQWTADTSGSGSSNTLANTGIDSANGTLFLIGGLSLALIGAELIMIARRKRSS